MAATRSVSVNSAPAKIETDGREALHTQKPDSFDLFGNIPRPHWPMAGIDKQTKDASGREALHIEEHHFLYFTGSDLWPHWAFAHAGVLWSPGGLDSEGFALKLHINSGVYRYLSGALNNTTIIGRQSSLTAMPGWRFKRNGYEITIFAGLDYQQFQFLPDDPGTNLRGRHMGYRATIELWHEPSTTTMLAADASVSSIGAGNYARLAYGWRVFDHFYLGPEVQAFTSGNYRHARVGMHVTASKNYEHEWSGAIGFAEDSDRRSGLYIRIGYLTRR